ncbi:MAG TPA: hypothetical protein VF456_13325 [Vicinamibacterales bacterium]
MTPDLFLRTAILPAFGLLPEAMDGPQARAMVLAIALQESDLRYRQQRGGPARGFVQFERGGIEGVLLHPSATLKAADLCRSLNVDATTDAVYEAIAYQDVLCAGFARLALWTCPLPLASPSEPPAGWRLYVEAWKPGKPRAGDWSPNFAVAWNAVLQQRQTEVLKA